MNVIEAPHRRWYVIASTARGQFRLAADLEERKIEAFLPTFKRYTLIRHTKGRRRETIFPLMGRYMFVRVEMSPASRDVAQVEACKNFACWIKPRQAPRPIPARDHLVAELQRLCASGAWDQGKRSGDGYLPGDRVRIVDGPFAGLTASFKDNKARPGFVRIVLDMMFSGKIPLEIEEGAILAA